MPINPNIALQYKGLQLQDPLQSYGRALQIKQIQQQMAGQEQSRAAELRNQALAASKERLRYVTTPEEYLDWHRKNHADPILGPALAEMGVSPNEASLMAELSKPNGLLNMIERSAVGADKFAEVLASQQTRQRDQEAMNALMGRSAAPVVAPAAPAAQVTMPGANGTTIGQVTPQSAVLGRPLGAPGAMPPPTNAMAAPAAAPVNAMMAQPGATDQTAEINRLMDVAMRFPGTEAGKAAMERAKMIQQMMPKPVSDTELVRNYEYAVKQGYTGTLDQFRKSTRPVTTVNLGPQQTQEQKARGDLLVEEYKAVQSAANTAKRTLPAIEANLAILDKGFDTGFGTEAKTAAAKVLGALGVENAEEYATNSQIFLANASAAVLQKQLDQKGPQTEADAQRITQTGAQLGNSKEANEFLLNVAKAQIKRDIEQQKFYNQWWKNNKTYDGAEDAWINGEGGKSLFERPELKKYTSTQQPKVDTRKPLSEIFGGGN